MTELCTGMTDFYTFFNFWKNGQNIVKLPWKNGQNMVKLPWKNG